MKTKKYILSGSVPHMARLLGTLIGLHIGAWASAQTIGIQGNAPDYAGVTFRFYAYNDYITYTEDLIMQCTVAADGSFAATGTLTHEGMIFARTGTYFLYFYAVPNADYTLYPPPRKEKSKTDSLNLFFEETPIHVGTHTTAANDINRTMMDGDCPSAANTAGTSYFAYCRYRQGLEKYRSVKQKVKSLAIHYFRNQPILYYNEAYMDLFNQVYNRYFEFMQRDEAQLLDIINRERNLPQLKAFILRDTTFRDDALLELVMLKNLYENFYTPTFSHESLLSLVKAVAQTTLYAENKNIAQNIINRVTLLMAGYTPPDFTLYDTAGAAYHLADFRGKALYLIFGKVFSYVSINAFEKLFTPYNVYHDAIEIVVVSVDEDTAQLQEFCRNERYRWHFLHYGDNPDVLKKYNISVLPTYFLLDKEGKLLLSPAPSPFGDIEQVFKQLHNKANRQ
ncbi:MAG: redoxin domain-containing protein [Prevotellaceae bacterium]|jgi:peroxiredoxin|nr:redoxin domain-containing protein [Prevotellaceae bacterium]